MLEDLDQPLIMNEAKLSVLFYFLGLTFLHQVRKILKLPKYYNGIISFIIFTQNLISKLSLLEKTAQVFFFLCSHYCGFKNYSKKSHIINSSKVFAISSVVAWLLAGKINIWSSYFYVPLFYIRLLIIQLYPSLPVAILNTIFKIVLSRFCEVDVVHVIQFLYCFKNSISFLSQNTSIKKVPQNTLENANRECCICHYPITDAKDATFLSCGHISHGKCASSEFSSGCDFCKLNKPAPEIEFTSKRLKKELSEFTDVVADLYDELRKIEGEENVD